MDVTLRPADAATERAAETVFEAAKRVLNGHFNLRVNITFKRHVFKQATQDPDETLDQFHTRLVELAEGCSFHNKDDEIKSQIIYLQVQKVKSRSVS